MSHRILIVDDEAIIRKTLTDALQQKGYQTRAVETGPLALTECPVFRPELVLLDIHMPGMNGITVLEKIMHINPDIKVIMLTASADDKTGHMAIDIGAVDFITKPFYLEQLFTTIAVHLIMDEDEPTAS